MLCCLEVTHKGQIQGRGQPVVQVIKDKNLHDHVSKVLKSSKSFEGFLGNLQKVYPHAETYLSVIGEIQEIAHLALFPCSRFSGY